MKGVFLMGNKMKKTQNNKMQDGHFKKVNIKHGQQESSRAEFSMKSDKNFE